MLDPAAVSAALDSTFGRAMGIRLGGALMLWVLLSIVQAGSVRALALVPVVGWVLALFSGSSALVALAAVLLLAGLLVSLPPPA